MKKYAYEDGYVRTVENGYITPKQLHDDERTHGELLFVNDMDNRRIVSPVPQGGIGSEKRGLIYGKTRVM